jgi:hypothetical protein
VWRWALEGFYGRTKGHEEHKGKRRREERRELEKDALVFFV